MCLGIPGKVVNIYEQAGTLMASVDFDGVQQAVCIDTTPEVQVGQYVLVHAGFAIEKLMSDEAAEIEALWDSIRAFAGQ